MDPRHAGRLAEPGAGDLEGDRRHVQRDVPVVGSEQMIDEGRGAAADVDHARAQADAERAEQVERRVEVRLVPRDNDLTGAVPLVPVGGTRHSGSRRVVRGKPRPDLRPSRPASTIRLRRGGGA